MNYVIDIMIYLGSALMLYNIYGFVRFARSVSSEESWEKGKVILYIPIVLLVSFLLGYIAVAAFGKPDLIMSGILFGGSVFVFVMYRMLFSIAKKMAEQKQLEAKLMATEESNRAKTEFLSGISHEMRTPMNIILGLDTLALNNTSLSDETREYLEKIGLSANHLLEIINNILDMNSIETGEFLAKCEEFSLGDTVWQINSIIESRCAEKGLTYNCNMESEAEGRYSGDVFRIKQILIHLLDNAIKFTDAPGRVELNIERIVADSGALSLKFTVKDTGIGINADFLPKIFDVFAREDASTTSRYSGSGLGLAVTKNIIDALGGSISVESEKGKGTAFTAVLPAVWVEKTADTKKDEISISGKRVLIAEDIPENAEIVADLLELEEVESEHAENGRIAVDMFKAAEPGYYDAILMDLRMPEMDGLTATRIIRGLDRADAKRIPIIALSANAFESDIKESLGAGMDAHLAKPADAELLYSTLKKTISSASEAGENK